MMKLTNMLFLRSDSYFTFHLGKDELKTKNFSPAAIAHMQFPTAKSVFRDIIIFYFGVILYLV